MKLLLTLLWLTSFSAAAVTVAVIDTGFDLDHEALKPKLRLGETDEEGALALPGLSEWAFQDNTHLKSTVLPSDVMQEILLYRTLKAKLHQQGLSSDERAWIDRKASDPDFKQKLKIFKKHAHGTLVTGILLREGAGIEVLPVRGIGIDIPTLVVESEATPSTPIMRHSEAEFLRQVKLSEERIIRKMRKMLQWIHHNKIRVVNGSYGVSEKQILRRFAEWHKEITGLELDPIKLRQIVDDYFKSLYKRADDIVAAYPNTLYIFSAGNSGQDNDRHHHFPSRLRRDNVVSVAALNGERLAHFSNFGATHVDVAAQGVGVISLIPSVYTQQTGMTQTPASGTSMAAPSVSNLAARCLQINEKLQASEIKRIILETGRPLEDLKGKTVSHNTVDDTRALKAARLSLERSVEESIALATNDVVAPLQTITPPPAVAKPRPPVISAPILTEDLDDPEESATPAPTESSSLAPDPATKTPDTSARPASVAPVAPPSAETPAATPAP